MTTYASRLECSFTSLSNDSPYIYQRMFQAACEDLASISRLLGLNPNDGGADSILDVIQELFDEIEALRLEAFELRNKKVGEL